MAKTIRILSVSPLPFWDVEDRKGMPSIYLGQKGFVDAGHEVLYMFASGETKQYDCDGIHIQEFKMRFRKGPHNLWLYRFWLKLYWLTFFIFATIKGLQLCKEFRPDVVYGHFFHGAPVAWAIGRIRRIPNITRMYGTFLYPRVLSKWGRLLKFENVLAFTVPCSYLIVTNDGTRGDDCAAVLGVPEGRLKFWRNGVDKGMYDPSFDTDKFKDSLSIPRNHKVILALSRLVGWKKVDRLITAMPLVLEKFPCTTAVIVGDGEERANLERLSEQLRLQEHIRFVGLILHEDVGQFLNGADLFVSLYDVSNVGNPMLEALCCGKCVLSINNGATGKIIRNAETGILIEETELHLLPDVLVNLLMDDERRATIGQAAREYALKNLQTWPERIQMEVNLIERLVESYKT